MSDAGKVILRIVSAKTMSRDKLDSIAGAFSKRLGIAGYELIQEE